MIRALSRGTAVWLISWLPLLGWADDADWPQSLYLPGITISASVGEAVAGKERQKRILGRCDILIWVTADGYIRVTQVIKSTGHARLDEACLRAILGGKKLIPAQGTAGPIDRWAIIPLTWEALMVKEPNAPDRLEPSAPLAPNQILPVKPSDFPKGARQRGEQGNSWVRAEVSDSGQVLSVKISQGSGSSELDNTALDVIRSARFSPAFSDHKPVNSSADVVISWVLPEVTPAVPSTEQR